MLYTNAFDNLDYLMGQIGYAKKEQLIKFFSDEYRPDILEHFLKMKICRREYDYNENTGIVSLHNLKGVSENEIKNRIFAFWVVLSFKSKHIREISIQPHPGQFFFITSDNEMYDITVCPTVDTAFLFARNAIITKATGIEDQVIHLALVYNKEAAQSMDLGRYGFDSYCVLDSNNAPLYGDV